MYFARGDGKSTMSSERAVDRIMNKAYTPIRHFAVQPWEIELTSGDNPVYRSTAKMYASVVNCVDNLIYDAVIEWAKGNGITDLYFIDKEFVKTALMNEIKRRKGEE